MGTENNAMDVAKSSNSIQQFNFFNPEHFAVMQRVCTMFATSELVPDMYRISEKNPKDKAIANCLIAVEMASRIGASPLMVMQNLYIVYGRPGWSAKFLIASVNACGKYEALDYKIRSLGKLKDVGYTDYVWNQEAKKKLAVQKKYETEIENFECIAYTKELKSGKLLESPPVTIELAIQEGWYQKDGSKWRTMTKLMLMYRSATFWTNTHAPELSMGIRTSDELEDYLPFEEIQVAEKVAAEILDKANKTAMTMDEKPVDIKTPPVGESQGNAAQPAAGTTNQEGQPLSIPGF